MNRFFKISTVLIFTTSLSLAQGFKVKATGIQTFSFTDERGRNQTTFFSATPLEDINGTASGISGTVTFDINNFASTLKGKIVITASSLKTGIDLRDEHLKSANWLDAEKYPEIVFEIKKVISTEQVSDNKLKGKVLGAFTMHGFTKDVTANFEATYLEENEQTKMRAPGDLLGIRANFNIILSEYGISNSIIGNKVADKIEVGVNFVGSNKN